MPVEHNIWEGRILVTQYFAVHLNPARRNMRFFQPWRPILFAPCRQSRQKVRIKQSEDRKAAQRELGGSFFQLFDNMEIAGIRIEFNARAVVKSVIGSFQNYIAFIGNCI